MDTLGSKLKAIIIDDEKRCVDALRIELERNCPEVELLGGYSSPKEGLLAIKNLRPDLIFLDIEMPWMNGFELLELAGKPFFEVIFTTAYDRFAIKAFQFSAIDYLLKPVDPADLKRAVNKVLQKLVSPLTQEHIQVLMKNFREASNGNTRIALPSAEGYEFVLVNDIVYCQAESNYTKIILVSGKSYIISRTLKEMQSLLTGYTFFRIHQSFLINLNHIGHYTRGDGGYVKMIDGAVLSVARAKKDEFMQMIRKFQ